MTKLERRLSVKWTSPAATLVSLCTVGFYRLRFHQFTQQRFGIIVVYYCLLVIACCSINFSDLS